MFNVSALYMQSIKLLLSKVVVGVDRPMKAPSMHIQKPYKGKIVQVLTAVIFFFQNYFLQTILLHAYVQCVYIVSAKYQIVPSKAVEGVDLPLKAPSMHIQEPY